MGGEAYWNVPKTQIIKSKSMTIESILEEFDKGVANNYQGQDPYWPNWEGVKDFLRQSLLSYGQVQKEKGIEEELFRERENIDNIITQARQQAYREVIEAIPVRWGGVPDPEGGWIKEQE